MPASLDAGEPTAAVPQGGWALKSSFKEDTDVDIDVNMDIDSGVVVSIAWLI